jgi:ABC-type transport system substrate-binding protein
MPLDEQACGVPVLCRRWLQEMIVSFKTSYRLKSPLGRAASCPPAASPGLRRRLGVAALHAAVIALAIMPAACSDSPYPDKDANANIFYNSIADEIGHLDPARVYGADSAVLANIVETPFQYNYVDRPYKLDPLLAVEVPKPEQRKVQYKGKTIDATVYTIRLRRGVIYQNHPCFVEANRRLTESDLRGIRGIADFKKTAKREMVAADFVYGIRRLCDLRLECPAQGAFAANLLGFQDYVDKLKELLEAERKVRAEAAGLLYNQEQDEQFNPIILDYNKAAEGIPFIGEVDKYAFEVVLLHPYPQILYWMEFQFFSPLPPEAMEFYEQPGLLRRGITFDFNPVGTGPYVLESYDPTNQVVLVRNPNFREELYPSLAAPGPDADPEVVENYKWMKNDGMLEDSGKRLPFIDQIVFRMEKEAIPRWNKFMQGYYEASGILADSFDQAVSLSSRGDLSITDEMRERGIDMIMVDSAYLGYYAFNMTDPVLGGLDEKKQKLRQAISIAIDAGEKLDIFNNGLGTQAQHAIPPGVFGHEATEAGINPYVFRWDKQRNAPVRRSIEDAKKLLAEAGYPGGYGPDGLPLEIKYLMMSPTPGQRSELKLLQKQLGRINIRLQTEDCDTTRFFDKIRKGSFQFVRFGWLADYPDPETFLILFYMPEVVTPDMQNQSRYDNPRFNELYRQMSRMENTPERKAILREMLHIMCKDAPGVFESHGMALTLRHSWLHNMCTYPLASNTMKYQRIDVPKRTAYRNKYNVPKYWPVAILMAVLAALAIPAALATRRHMREK